MPFFVISLESGGSLGVILNQSSAKATKSVKYVTCHGRVKMDEVAAQ